MIPFSSDEPIPIQPSRSISDWIDIANDQIETWRQLETEQTTKLDVLPTDAATNVIDNADRLLSVEATIEALQQQMIQDFGVEVTLPTTSIYPDWMIPITDDNVGLDYKEAMFDLQRRFELFPPDAIGNRAELIDMQQYQAQVKEQLIKSYIDSMMILLFGATKYNLCDNFLVRAGAAILNVLGWIVDELVTGVQKFFATLFAIGEIYFPNDETVKRLLGEYFSRFYCDFRNSRDIQMQMQPALYDVLGIPKPPALPPLTEPELINTTRDPESGFSMRQLLESVLSIRDYAKDTLNEAIIGESGNELERWSDIFRQEQNLTRISNNVLLRLDKLLETSIEGNEVSTLMIRTATQSERSVLLSLRLPQSVVTLPPIEPLPPVDPLDMFPTDMSTGRDVLEAATRVKTTTLRSISNNVKMMGSANRTYYNTVRDAQRETEATLLALQNRLGQIESYISRLQRQRSRSTVLPTDTTVFETQTTPSIDSDSDTVSATEMDDTNVKSKPSKRKQASSRKRKRT